MHNWRGQRARFACRGVTSGNGAEGVAAVERAYIEWAIIDWAVEMLWGSEGCAMIWYSRGHAWYRVPGRLVGESHFDPLFVEEM